MRVAHACRKQKAKTSHAEITPLPAQKLSSHTMGFRQVLAMASWEKAKERTQKHRKCNYQEIIWESAKPQCESHLTIQLDVLQLNTTRRERGRGETKATLRRREAGVR